MSRMVLLDAGPLGMATNPTRGDDSHRRLAWLLGLAADGVLVRIPEGAYYEVRRELFLRGKRGSRDRLDRLADQIGFLPVTIAVWRRASELWAMARREGIPTSDAAALDCDVILAAQAELMAEEGYEVVVATTNVGHLGRFVDAREWEAIEG